MVKGNFSGGRPRGQNYTKGAPWVEPLSFSWKRILAGLLAAMLAGAMAAAEAAAVTPAGDSAPWRRVVFEALRLVQEAGPLGPLLLGALFIGACIFMLPTFYFTIGAGVLFGLKGGFFVATLSVAGGASAAFLLCRFFAGKAIARRYGGSPFFQALMEATAQDGWKIVFLSRLSPLLPFNVLNFAFGLTGISYPAYLMATWAGSIPWTFMYVYAGALAANLAGLHPHILSPSKGGWLLSLVSLAATAGATAYGGKIARKTLEGRLKGGQGTKKA